MEISQLYGRQVTDRQLAPDDIIQLNLTGENALLKSGFEVCCQRCLGRTPLNEAMLPNGDYYCRNCIQFGRLTNRNKLYRIREPNQFDIPSEILTWKGTLSPFQAQCAQQLIEKVAHRQNHLVWAVTGAGKTEMLFPMLTESIRQGKELRLHRRELMFVMNYFHEFKQHLQTLIVCCFTDRQINIFIRN